MIYVFDSSTLIDLFNHMYPGRFPSLWKDFDTAVENGEICSVREVHSEITDRIGKEADRLAIWANKHQDFFPQPTAQELHFVTEIFRVKHFQTLVRNRERLLGKPVADPFLIARAHVLKGCVVTEEGKKPNAAKIPNVCDHFGIRWTNLEGFMEKLDWTY